MIVGPLVDNYMLLEQIEQLGAYIVYDDITNGARYCDMDVVIQGDLYENIARRYLLSGPSPTLNSNNPADDESFRKLICDLDLQGVIFINQKFCEPHVHNYLSRIETLKQMKINFLMLEVEHDRLAVSQRDLLRIESFIEVAQRN